MINYSVKIYSKKLFVDNQKSFPNARVLLGGIKFLCKQFESIFSIKEMYKTVNLTGLNDLLMRLNDTTYKLSSFKKLARAFSTNIVAKKMIDAIVNIGSLYEIDPDFYQDHVINKENISKEDLHEFMGIMKEIAKNHVQNMIDKIDAELIARSIRKEQKSLVFGGH